jgi:hypothetical protein
MGFVADAAPSGMFPDGNVDPLAGWSCICGEYAKGPDHIFDLFSRDFYVKVLALSLNPPFHRDWL